MSSFELDSMYYISQFQKNQELCYTKKINQQCQSGILGNIGYLVFASYMAQEPLLGLPVGGETQRYVSWFMVQHDKKPQGNQP
jgi:hypothetical protein